MMNYRDDPEYLALNQRCMAMEIESAQITADLDASYFAFMQGTPDAGPVTGKLQRAEMIARRSALRLETKVLGAQINLLKDRIRTKRHEDLLGELKNVLNENGLGHYVKIAFDRASVLFNHPGESHEFQT